MAVALNRKPKLPTNAQVAYAKDKLDELIEEIDQVTVRLKEDGELNDRLRAEALEQIKILGKKTHETAIGKLTQKVRTDTYLDEEKLRKKVGARIWNSITRRVLDKTLLKAASLKGTVTDTVIAQVSETHTGDPYLQYTPKAR